MSIRIIEHLQIKTNKVFKSFDQYAEVQHYGPSSESIYLEAAVYTFDGQNTCHRE